MSQDQTPATKKTGLMAAGIAVVLLLMAAGTGLAIRSGVITPPAAVLNVLPSFLWPQPNAESGLRGGLMGDLPQTGEQAKLALMLQTGQSGVCTISSKSSDDQMTYSIKGKKFLIEGMGVGEEEMTYGYMLSDGEYQYIWSDGEPQGVKFKLPSEEEMAELDDITSDWPRDEYGQPETDFPTDFEEDEYDMSCSFQNLADSLFVPPTNIQFLDMSAGFGEMINKFGGDQTPGGGQDDFDWSEFESLMMSQDEIDFSNWE